MQRKIIKQSISIIFVLILIILLFYGFSTSNKERIIKQNEAYLESITIHSANQLDNTLKTALTDIKSYAYFYSELMENDLIDSEDLSAIEDNSHFDYVRFTTADGYNVTSKLNETSDAKDREYYIEGMKGNSGISIVDRSRITNETLVNFYTPLIRNDKIIGVLRGVYLTDKEMKNLLDTIYFKQKINTIVVDENGFIISTSLQDNNYDIQIGKSIVNEQLFGKKANDILSDCINNKKSSNFSFEINNSTVLAYIAKMDTNNWYLIQLFPSSITDKMYQDAISSGLTLEVSLIIIFLVYLVYNFISYQKTKKKLLEANRDMNYIIKGTPKLYDSMIIVDLINNTYRYLIGDNHVLSEAGNYLDLKQYITTNAANDDISKELNEKLSIRHIKESLKDSDKEYEIEYQTVNNDSWMRLNLISIEKFDNDITKVIIAKRDITDIKKQEIKKNKLLQDAIKKANSANRSKDTFLFNMSHDIRTPINAIMGFTHLIKEHIDNKELVINYLGKIEKSSDILCHIIDDVLDLARIENGRVGLDMKKVDLYEISNTIAEMFQDAMCLKHIEFVNDFEFDNSYVIVDANKLNQIAINLLSNAQKFTPEGGKIIFSFKQVSNVIDNQAMYEMITKDNGIGISEEFLPKIFNVFERERDSTSSKIPGTGLGLSIVKHFVDIMNGQISVNSKVNEGSEFKVTFILDVVAQLDKNEVKLNEDFLKGKRVLLAEDNEFNQEIVTDILNNKGCIVELASDGNIAYNMIKEAKDDYYDFILMDIQMPNLNGYEACRKIRMLDSDNKNIIIIAMSANVFEEDKLKAYQSGMNGFIAKPLNVNEMLKTLAKIIK